MFKNFGRDDDGYGALIGIIIGLMVLAMIIAAFCYAGVFIGGIKAIANYIKAFKHNVVDPKPIEA